jgi:hypothetical protein
MAHPSFTGGCQCGAVRYRFKAEPARRSVCHCRMCQKALGNVFAPFAGGALAEFEWTRGAPKIFHSSDVGERGFCADCGTPLTYRDMREPKIFLTVGSFDDPSRLAPTVNTGIQGKLAWIDAVAGLPSSETEPDPAYKTRQHPDHDT